MSDIWIDFNSINEAGRTCTMRKYCNVPLIVGATIIAGDYEGNTCPAKVVDMTDFLVWLDVDLSMFVPAP